MHVSGSNGELIFKRIPQGCTVLVVDDDPVCLDEYRDTIVNLGYDLVCAGNAS